MESHLNPITVDESFHFINPKAGISYKSRAGTLYASYSIGHREPIRDDYIYAAIGEKPKPETLRNLEIGLRNTGVFFQYAVNYFLMNYVNQLILTGEINDDGAFIRRNSEKSYRTGIELSAGIKLFAMAELSGNMSLSLNRTDYRQADDMGLMTTYRNKPISFSPSVVAGAQSRIFPVKNLEIQWLLKYVGKQFLDNTGNDNLSLNSYFINDARIAYLVSTGKMPAIELTLMVNNLFNVSYESNGSVYNNEPYYFPQAGTNIMGGVNLRF